MNYLVCLSGGIDSTTVLAHVVENVNVGDKIGVVLFKYPSKHNEIERNAALKISHHYNIQYGTTIDVSWAFSNLLGSTLLSSGGDIPEGHYTDESMKSTVVPLRNIVFATCAAIQGHTMFNGQEFVLMLGVHSGDHPIYPDCRVKTMQGLRSALMHGSDGLVDLNTPFIYNDKIEIVEYGVRIKAPYHLTRTCYQSTELACGKCGSCVERLEAFQRNGVEDPIPYAP